MINPAKTFKPDQATNAMSTRQLQGQKLMEKYLDEEVGDSLQKFLEQKNYIKKKGQLP
eukprot:CAMPEP_0170513406 /NCGR_PEP_ID=MMETSP0208-20121228/67384_1 /TAXON_ID=197538 /ORGANISM="Strombidium inclinatum, Strain S3" /LENGTH=57 /DNA_ID=CAMNT_0010797135 /DNA_START=855 /DNA_END=1025 /DNA_ORIENTATION=+